MLQLHRVRAWVLTSKMPHPDALERFGVTVSSIGKSQLSREDIHRIAVCFARQDILQNAFDKPRATHHVYT
jgi:hypothetical protein